MNVELSPEEAQNLIAFINAYPAKEQAQEVAVMLKLKLTKAIQDDVPVPLRDGAKEPAEA
jgi:hypothetical protein